MMALTNEGEIRAQILVDIKLLSEKGSMLSPGWWRQLGDEEKATEVEELLRHPRTSGRCPSNKKRREAAGQELHEIDCILDERKTTGRAGVWYLVRWAGYHPEWEAWRIRGDPGTPIETWEPKVVVHRTLAFLEWQDTRRADSAACHAPRRQE